MSKGQFNELRLRKITALAVLFFVSLNSMFAQITKIVPLQNSPEISKASTKNSTKPGLLSINDTLILPFFEDFAETGGYPNQDRWTDKQVWINNSFCKNAPNFNVATFDHLNQFGKPYTNLDKNVQVFADSLTSQPMNLQYYFVGSNTIPYKPTDNIYLSFFYQAQGFGDMPEAEDSLILYFKAKNGVWKRVWSTGGGTYTDFTEIFVPVNDYAYLNRDFQFRFVNYTKSTGNLNHWNIDYIRLDKNRMSGLADIQDVGILNLQSGLLNDYHNLPYSHYRYALGEVKGEGAKVWVRNLNLANTVQTRFALKVENRFGQPLFNQVFGSSSRNILANKDSSEIFATPTFDTLSTPTPLLKYKFSIAPQSNDMTPINYNASTDNNSVEMTHQFMPWYAYDDGSAEGGFGLDYAFLGNIRGQFAMEFKTVKDDSLRGLAVYFTQTNADVSYRSFKLRIWRKLSPIGAADNKDELIYDLPVDHPVYRDSINQFYYFFFDSAIFLPRGTYYAGWLQNMPFVLNVGYDNNYRYQQSDNQPNPHLFYNLLGSWSPADYSVKGTPMIRMLYGSRVDYAFATKTIAKPKLTLFPNPAKNILQVIPSFGRVLRTDILDLSGRLAQTLIGSTQQIDVSNLSNGLYIVKVYFEGGQTASSRFIKN